VLRLGHTLFVGLSDWINEAGGEGEAPDGFVLIPAGSFAMGCTPAQAATGDCESDESPVHTVTLTQDFYMGATEVTQGEFESLMGYNPSDFDSCGSDRPVESLNWYESAAYANALSSSEGLDSCYTCTGSGSGVSCSPVSESDPDPYSCEGYRLPTEAEWEYAARAGTDLVYAGSDDLDAVAWTSATSGGTPHAVGSLSPNGWGLYDMSGNVWEWTGDWYDGSTYDRGDSVDPVGASTGSYRVNRGGSWNNPPRNARVAFRDRNTPDNRYNTLGLRLLRTIP
jgi:sulfatase modifying factor 1